MTLEEGILSAIYLFILCLAAVRFLSGERGRVIRRFKNVKAMTIWGLSERGRISGGAG